MVSVDNIVNFQCLAVSVQSKLLISQSKFLVPENLL